jgi:putative aldouronate transport system permease protein
MKNRKNTMHYCLMMIPGFAWLIFFTFIPMAGVVIAFKDFNPRLGVLGSGWVGLAHFRYMFNMPDISSVFANTIAIAVGKLIGNLAFPLLFALMLHMTVFKKVVRPTQTIAYLPFFISWVILSGIVLDVFGYVGPVNAARKLLGMAPILFFGTPSLFRPLVIWTDVWKVFGYHAIIYLAALTGIDPTLHEAAAIDGAGRFRRLRHVTMPGIRSTVVLLAILSLGNVLNAGFDQIFNLYNPAVYATGDIIDTWVYRAGLKDLQFSLATAVGLLKSAISFVLIVLSYRLAERFADYKIF